MDDRPAIKFDVWPFSEGSCLVIKDQEEATGTLLDRHRIALSEAIDGDVHRVPDTPGAHMRRRISKPDREKCSPGLTITYTKAENEKQHDDYAAPKFRQDADQLRHERPNS
jgi:hypothetical protein